ncbi:centrosomal protein of 135 kDa isoform X1 [Osmerus eperlanus]|uniref:centrosomal protein of 135 kDa isoform X1 n=2 Tax=Osmerus eperlanus TaxID=29151 RepID=UPI002E101E7F
MSTNAERKFLNLRKRLDQLGYRQPLGIETLPLVEKLFSDLVHTTESLRNTKMNAGKTEKESRNLDALLEPYKTENARIVRENNELHSGLLKLREEKDLVSRELKAFIRKLDHETSDLKFLNNQYVHKVRAMEKESKVMKQRIQQLQEKNMQAVVQTPGGKKHSIPFRRQRMQIDELVPPASGPTQPVPQPDDPYIADLLLVADDRITELQQDIVKLKLDLERAQGGIKHLNSQVEERDREIERLTRALDGGRPHNVISLEAQTISNEKLIAHLNLQIEYLQETNRTLEQKVQALQQRRQDASGEVADLSAKNQELCQELTDIDQLAKQLERDKEMVLATADQELQETKKEIQRQHEMIMDLEEANVRMRRNHSEGDFEKGRLRDQMTELRDQNAKMEGLIHFLKEETTRLQEKLDAALAAEKELVLELERMRTKHGVCGRERSPSRLDVFVRSLEEERDHYKQAAERYLGSLGPGTTPSPGRDASPRVRRGWNSKGGSLESELSRTAKERDELRAILLGFERHMEDIRINVKTLTVERDQLSAQCKQVSEDLIRARQLEGQLSAEVTRLEEQADVERQRVTSERDAFGEQLKDAQTAALAIGEVEEQKRIPNLENAMKTLQRERSDLQSQVTLLKEGRLAAEDELTARCSALAQAAEENAQQRAESNALRLLQEQMEQSLFDAQHRLLVKTNELQAAHHQIEKLEEKIGEMDLRGSTQHGEARTLQKTVSALDREKDALQEAVDQKTEKMVVLQEELSRKDKTLEDVRRTVTDMESSLDQLKGALSSREREIGSLRRQLNAAHEELAVTGRDREVTLRENRRLQDDLATMTRENQAVHGEMEEVLHEKDELKMRVHSYISEVARIESLMALKEQENRDMLEQFRAAHYEVEERGKKLEQVQGLNNSIHLELLSSDTERRHLREKVSHQEREIQEHMSALQAYESQVSSLGREMSRLEEELRAAREERAAVLSDLASVRELCVKLDSSRELTTRQLNSRSMEMERVTGELEDVRSETDILKNQLANERLTVRNLETLLSSNRQKEFQTHLSASERESELKILRDRLALADGKLVGNATEVSQLRGKVSQLQTEMDVLKRQLTTERFERERAVQELRRQGLSLSSLQNSSPLSTSLGTRPTSPERSILRTPERSDRSPEKSVSFKE